jgi:hypothetical protein
LLKINLSDLDDSSKRVREILSAMNLPINKKTEAFAEKYIQSRGGIDIFDEEIKRTKENYVKQQQQVQEQQQYHQYQQQQNIPVPPTVKPPPNPPPNKTQ